MTRSGVPGYGKFHKRNPLTDEWSWGFGEIRAKVVEEEIEEELKEEKK